MTARYLFHRCRKAGITFSRNGSKLVVDYRDGRKWTPELRRSVAECKAEMLALVDGDYLSAAKEMVIRETQPGDRRAELVMSFDERLAVCLEGKMSYEQACRAAYVHVAKEVERIKTEEGRLV